MDQMTEANLATLSRLVAEKGDGALPYPEEVKYGVKTHVAELIKSFPSLNVKDEEYTHNDGRSVRLIKLDGTLPMYYQNTKYNIPVNIWVTDNYPREPPIVYVTPTSGMIIKPNHSFVSASGTVQSAYLKQHWNSSRSNLVDMAYDMAILFGQEPPLFQKPPGYTPPPAHPEVSRSPHPHIFQGNNPMVRPSYPPGASSNVYQYAPNTTPQSQPGQGFWWGGRPQQQTNPVPGSHAHPQHPHSRHPTEAELMNQFRNAAIKALNKRLTVSLEAHGSKIAAEAEELAENERKLHSRTAEIEKKVAALQEERGLLEARVRMMAAKSNELSTWLQQVGTKVTENMDHLDPESVIVPADALCAQALEAQAEDMALEDTLYALDKALQQGVIDLDAYLKQVRKIGKQQFMCRALGIKIAEAQHGAPSVGTSNHGSSAGVMMPQGDSWTNTGMLINPLNPGSRA